jgi:cold shock CspA family protein
MNRWILPRAVPPPGVTSLPDPSRLPIIMSREYSFGTRKSSSRRAGAVLRPAERRGVPAAGRIVKLLVGQGYGYIRLANDREIYFHRADVQEGTSINDLHVGDTVTFDLLDDTVSGARALGVRRQQRGR